MKIQISYLSACLVILLAVMAGNQAYSQGVAGSRKLIYYQNQVYRAKSLKSEPVLMVADPQKLTNAYYRLPTDTLRAGSVAYDIRKDYIYFISEFAFFPPQRSFYLVKSPLRKLDVFTLADTASKKGLQAYSPESITDYFEITPLNAAFDQALANNTGPVYYDITVSAAEQISLFILEGQELTVWEAKDKNWVKRNTTQIPFKSSFSAISLLNRNYIVAESGGIFEYTGHLKKVRQLKTAAPFSLIVNKDKNAVFTTGPLDLSSGKFKNIWQNARQVLGN